MRRRVVIITELIAPYRIPLFNALAEHANVDLHVIFLSKTDLSLREWRVYEDEITFSYEVLPSWRKRIGRYHILLNYQLDEALRRSAPEVILCGGYNYLASWQALRWARSHKIRFLLWSESTGSDKRSRHPVVESLKQTFFRNCDAFVVPGQSAMRYLEEMGVAHENIYVARNAVDIDLFAASGESARSQSARLRAQLMLPERYFLFAGRLVREKGVIDLLDAYALLPAKLREQIGLVFAGDGPLRSELEAFARNIYPGHIHFAGFLDRDDLARYYGLAECLVLPTYTDVWGMVVNEAMACSLPVICTRVAGAAELVRDNGRLIAPGAPPELSAAMREIACDQELRREMSVESEVVIREYSPAAWACGIAEAAASVGGV